VKRVANPTGETLPWDPMEDFGQMIFRKKSPLGFHLIMCHGGGERGAGTIDDRSGIVCALENLFRGRCI